LERGLKERSADTKKKAAQIVGNLASLTDSKDFVPYLSTLMPMVHVVLVDPVPEARATAAKTLGTLVERLGEINFPDLVPSLVRTLKTDTSGVDRQGAAQGLSEVLSGLGMERLEGLLPDIISNAQSPRSTIREGFMSLLVFLPATFGTRFQPHLPKIITPILKGLSDTEDYVREAAMRAGRMIITNYSSKAIDLLLPELEHGMFDPAWRIRVGAYYTWFLFSNIFISNPLSLSSENSCSRFPVSLASWTLMTTLRVLKSLLLRVPERPSLRFSVPNVGIAYYPPFIWLVRTPYTLSGSRQSKSGKHWCIIRRRLVR
jgi:HEAT repeats